MKKLFKWMLAVVVLFSATSCDLLGGIFGGEGNGGENNGGNGGTVSTSFSINVSNITATSATVMVTPSNQETYYFDVLEQAVVNNYDNLADFAVAYIDYLKEYSANYGYTIADVLSSGNDQYTFSGLNASTNYYAFAVGVDANGTVTSDVAIESFTTLSNGTGGGSVVSKNTFEVNVTNISSNSATISVVPSNSDTYYFDLVEKEVYTQFTDGQEFAAAYIAYLKEYYESYGYTVAELLSSGEDSWTYEGDLDPSTNYVAFAVGVSAEGSVTTNIATNEFTTLGSSSSSQNTFSIAVSGVTSNSATVSVNPSNSDTYYFDVIEKSTVDQYGNWEALTTDLVKYLKEMYESYGYSFADVLSSGADSWTYEGDLDPATTYYAYAFGVNGDGTITTGVASKLFTTEASGSTGGGTTTGGLNITNLAEGACTNYGDFYEMGATNYWIELYNATGTEALILDIQAAAAATSCVGTYPFNLTFEAGSAISGFLYEGDIYGSFWAALSGNSISEYAMITGGSVTISKSGNNYVITLNGADDNGDAITASYNGELVESVETFSKLSNGSNRKGFRLANLDSFKKLGGKNVMLQPIAKKLASTPSVAPLKMTIKKQVKLEAKVPFTVHKSFEK